MLLAPLFALLASVAVSGSPIGSGGFSGSSTLEARAIPGIRTLVNGTYVPAADFAKCPPLKRRPVPTNAADV